MKSSIKLFKHQEQGLKRVLNEPFFPLFMDPGTGKTAIAIKAIEKRYKEGLINRVLILAPNTLLYNWEIEIGKFLSIPKRSYVVEKLGQKKKPARIEAFNKFIKKDLYHCTLKELKARGYVGTKQAILASKTNKLLILLVNYEKARIMTKELCKFSPHKLIIDESHKVRNNNATSRAIYKISKKSDYIILMTGTPICNGYEDLFMQYKICNDKIFGTAYKDFEASYIIKGGYMNHDIVGYKNEAKLKKIVKKNSYQVKIEDCIKLPPIRTRYISCELGSKTRKAYDEMNKNMITQINNSQSIITRRELKMVCKEKGIVYSSRESYNSLFLKASSFLNTSSCDIILTQMMRLQQIAGGFITLDDGQVLNIGREKIETTKEIILESNNPVVIFCQFVPEIEALVAELSQLKRDKSNNIRVKSFRDTKTRNQVYQEFKENKLDVIILQLHSGSIGLNLQESNRVIFYSWNYSSDDYTQAIARIKRSGQTKSMEVIHIVAEETMDSLILDAIKNKQRLANKLLD